MITYKDYITYKDKFAKKGIIDLGNCMNEKQKTPNEMFFAENYFNSTIWSMVDINKRVRTIHKKSKKLKLRLRETADLSLKPIEEIVVHIDGKTEPAKPKFNENWINSVVFGRAAKDGETLGPDHVLKGTGAANLLPQHLAVSSFVHLFESEDGGKVLEQNRYFVQSLDLLRNAVYLRLTGTPVVLHERMSFSCGNLKTVFTVNERYPKLPHLQFEDKVWNAYPQAYNEYGRNDGENAYIRIATHAAGVSELIERVTLQCKKDETKVFTIGKDKDCEGVYTKSAEIPGKCCQIGYKPEWGWYVVDLTGVPTLLHSSNRSICNIESDQVDFAFLLHEGMIIQTGELEGPTLGVHFEDYSKDEDRIVTVFDQTGRMQKEQETRT
eukprot:TRINITY_DN8300_c0_g1_i11.p1 TRINITY_DN8300_c0_g1~~TRINITY_DN8300_c0_g1_i11.p1  ORF type:complete len:382 (-),score=86.07 TRINITY_DN8300_c0_g1_i11:306-1451(-)